MGFWEKVLPGYRGYREREDARNSDKKLRAWLSERLRQSRFRYDDIKADLTRRGNLELMNPAEKVTQLLGRVTDRIRYANYGFSGRWFGKDKIDADRLKRVEEFDKGLVELVEQVEKDINALALFDGDADISAALGTLAGQLNSIEQHLQRREEILRELGGTEPDNA
ncbi:MAG: hypothetical protein D6806_02845 [Deltaproteobacteria bacterium]|nr:MAG: hypothetical protein D6806_02845 [Deltaproteobacteria bacterium]